MKFDRKFWATAFTLTGTIIGAGILGLPYVFSRSGFGAGVFWLLFLGAIMIYVNLALGEVTLRTKAIHQLPGYAGRYLGGFGRRLMFFAMVFGIYSALLAYLIGEGQSFSQIFTGGLDYAIYFGVGFWVVMTLLLREGLKGLKKIETWGVLAIIAIVFWIFIYFVPNVQISNLSYVNWQNVFLPFGVVLFALLGFTSIAELRREIKGDEKLLKKAIFVGALIPVILYIMFSFVFVGVLGQTVTEVATLSFGKLINVLGIFTMLTSYFVLSFSLRDVFMFDMKKNRKFSFIFVSLIPLILFLFVSFFDLADFVKVLGIGGVVSGGLTGVLILLMNLKAKKLGDRQAEFGVAMKRWVVWALGAVFLVGVVVELVF